MTVVPLQWCLTNS